MTSKVKGIISAVSAAVMTAALSVTAFAEDGGGLGGSVVATGLKNLLNDASTILLGLAAVVGTVCIVYFCIRREFLVPTGGGTAGNTFFQTVRVAQMVRGAIK